ncbi:MAG: NAD-dependent epimerase/dehydratase family protein [Anaerolineae bacterium]|nr:NAD-dependent epimerase/dehydratase family protein [Anaerolineae bacterium]
MKYYVTGTTGFIGERVARQLHEAGHEVIAPVRNPAKAQKLVDWGVKVHKGDITDKASMRDAMAGVDGVYHIAGWYKLGWRGRADGQRINVDGTRNVLELMRELNIPKGVYTSTLAIFGDTHGKLVDERYRMNGPWLTAYDRTKWAAHYEVAEPMSKAGLPLVIVMPGVVYGPGDTSGIRGLFIDYLKRRLPMVPAQTAYCWGYIDDIAGAHILAMDRGKPGEDYIIAGPMHTLTDAFALAEKLTGIPAPKLNPPPGLVKLMAAFMGVVERAVPTPYTREGLLSTAGVTYIGNNAKARRELGYNPRPLEDGLRETLYHEMKLLGMPTPP